MISLLLLGIIWGQVLSQSSITIVVLSQKSELHDRLTNDLKKNVLTSIRSAGIKAKVLNTIDDFPNHIGSWTIFPILHSLYNNHQSEWYLFVEPETSVSLAGLASFISSEDPKHSSYFGFALQDTSPTIIHHFHGFDRQDDQMTYPDWSAGMLVSGALLKRIVEETEDKKHFSGFAIDPKHEFSRFLEENLSVKLQARNKIFCLFPESTCITQYKQYANSGNVCSYPVNDNNFYVAVKTFSEYHRTRLVVTKRTWANSVLHVDYISDIEDQFVPTITLGVENTNRGHCAKTFAILNHFYHNNAQNNFDWLIIADDDTLLSIPRLKKLLQCYNPKKKLIIGERYGYGFDHHGRSGYDYPTGGSGMVFSRTAVEEIVKGCSCPQADSPDDMILGMCAESKSIPLIHSPAFHQARHRDYSEDYIRKLLPISFHKLEEIDPYADYVNYLKDDSPITHTTTTTRHTEL
ncbi:unnamed protein product [Auanema sp. JU1783]|nr:unnamed protein product [Auanema sp. JU1783]